MARPDGASWPVGGGATGRLIRARDWGATALGPVAGWPQSLRTAVDICLAAPEPTTILWGAGRIQLYNDAYAAVARVAASSGITVLRTPIRAPRANASCERFLGSVRRECLDHILVLGEGHLRRVLREYAAYFNAARPHQGIGQVIPDAPGPATPSRSVAPLVASPVLGGLHHDYRRAA